MVRPTETGRAGTGATVMIRPKDAASSRALAPNHPTHRVRFGYVWCMLISWRMTEHPGDEDGAVSAWRGWRRRSRSRSFSGRWSSGWREPHFRRLAICRNWAVNISPPQHFSALGEVPGIARSALLSILIGLVTTLISLGAVAAFVASDLGTATFSRVRRLISPLAVGAARRGGFRAGLHDRAIRHDHAADLAMGHRA
jgi:hypothetical protein